MTAQKLDISKFAEKVIPKIIQLVSTPIRTLELKAQQDYVTNLDLSLDDLLKNEIHNHFRTEKIYSEEDKPGQFHLNDEVWLIDPLDGTSNAICNFGSSAVSIASIADKKVTRGMVFDFTRNELFVAEAGAGAYLGFEQLNAKLNNSHLIGMSTGTLLNCSASIIQKLSRCGRFRILGSQALHLCYVASNRLRLCCNFEAKLWDDVAGALILNEAGVCYTSVAGFAHQNVDETHYGVNLKSLGSVDKTISASEIYDDKEA